MFHPARALNSTTSLPVPLSAPLSPPDESTLSHDGAGRRGHNRASSSVSRLMGPPDVPSFGDARKMEPPRTLERKRKGRMVDVISALPTPPRTKDTRLDPTPPHHTTTTSSSSKRRSTRISQSSTIAEDEIITHDPTFSFSSSEWHPSSGTGGTEMKIRRRPGLTFAQQMAAAASSSAPRHVGKIHGVGIGMGGHRSHHPSSATEKVENMRPSLDQGALLLGAAPIEDVDGGNPFLAVSSANGRPQQTIKDADQDHDMVRFSNLSALASPIDASITNSLPTGSPQTSILALTSPPTRSIPINPPAGPAAPPPLQAKKRWTAPIVGEQEGNPFYVKPGEGRKVQAKRVEERDWEEKETVTYVFRGTKTTFANPYYRVPTGDTATSRLSTTHPDFSPAPAPKPRLLWPAASTTDADADVDMEAEDEDDRPKPRLLFSGASGTKRHADEDGVRDVKRTKHQSNKSGTFEMHGGAMRL